MWTSFKGEDVNLANLVNVKFLPEMKEVPPYYLGEWRSRVVLTYSGGAVITILATEAEYLEFKKGYML